ncbi:glycosyltransferase [Chloroflexota bacterium]
MKILHVVSSFKPAWQTGGTSRVAYEISKSLAEKEHEVTVFTTDRGTKKGDVPKNQRITVDNIRVYYFGNVSGYLARKKVVTPYYLPLIARKEIKGFDIIHVHEHRTIPAAIVHYYAKKHNIPYVLQTHGSLATFFQKGWLKRTYDATLGYGILQDAANVIAVTGAEAEQYKSMGVSEDRIRIIPHGVDLAEFKNLPERGEFRRKNSLGDVPRLILYLGRINKTKGLDLLVRAFADIAKLLDDIRLVIAGADDGYLRALKGLTNELRIGEKILFTGPLYGRQKLEAYVDCDVYTLPSSYEIFGITILEACACGVPVIVSDRCGLADVIDGQAGLVVPYNKDRLRDALLHMLNDDKMRLKFGKKGELLVREKFNWEKLVEQVEGVYRGILNA